MWRGYPSDLSATRTPTRKRHSQLAERIDRPILLLPGWNDYDMKPGSAVSNRLQRNLQGQMMKEGDVTIEFPTMIHGLVSRADSNDPKVAEAQQRALDMTVEFIHNHSQIGK